MRSCLALLVCGLSAQGCGADSGRPSGSTEAPVPVAAAAAEPDVDNAADGPGLSIASYNINAGMTGNGDTLDAVLSIDVDVLVLQEVTRGWWREIEPAHSSRYAHRKLFIDPRHRYGGLAILSKHSIEDSRVLRSAGPFAAQLYSIRSPLGAIQVLNVHLFPPVAWFRERGIIKAYQDSQVLHRKELETYVAALGAGPALVVGDFNENIVGGAMSWLSEQGFVPAHADGGPTWRWKVRGREVEFQLDHIMMRDLTASGARVDRVGGSDHYPIFATVHRP